VVEMLYEFFESPARDRLKRCAACPHWFADEPRNRGKRWHDEACHRRGGTRPSRRAARRARSSKKRAART
jgi:predicted RNA-binding Zn ribbon-like protein